MYKMKSIISTDYPIDLPACMYYMKNHNQESVNDDIELHISDQVMRFLKNTQNNNMMNLEVRQEQLLKKLDVLYEKIKIISSSCKVDNTVKNKLNESWIDLKCQPEELVLDLSPDNLPFFLILFIKSNPDLNYTWHIHSTTPNDKKAKIQSFFDKLPKQKRENQNTKVNLRIIFKSVMASSTLKISSLGLPIIGNVNILRYLSELYPQTIQYDFNNHAVENILDTCYLLECSNEKQKQLLYQKIFHSNTGQWIYDNMFTIIDLALYNEIKRTKSLPKLIPQQWLINCENAIL